MSSDESNENAADIKLRKIDRLNVAATVAPVLRGKKKPRRITTVDEDGKPVRVITDVELAKQVLKRADIEFSVQDGVRPKQIVCELCGSLVNVARSARVPRRCRKCVGGICVTCGAGLSDKASCPSSVKKRGGPALYCRVCANRPENFGPRRMAVTEKLVRHMRSLSPEEKGARASLAHAKRSPEERSAAARKGGLAATRSETQPKKLSRLSSAAKERRQQARLYDGFGRSQSLREWAEEFGVPYPRLHARVSKLGLTLEQALTMPVHFTRQSSWPPPPPKNVDQIERPVKPRKPEKNDSK